MTFPFPFFIPSRSVVFPSILGMARNSDPTNGNSATATLPSGVTAGESLLLVGIAADNSSVATLTASGWTEIFAEGTGSGGMRNMTAWHKTAAGGETTQAIGSSQSTTRIFQFWSFRFPATTIFEGSAATGSSSSPNPPSRTPSTGLTPTVFVSIAACLGSSVFTGYPTELTANRDTIVETSGPGSFFASARATVELDGSVLDPSAFTAASSGGWIASTISARFP